MEQVFPSKKNFPIKGVLISIFTTYFLQAQPFCGLNLCIILYFILLSKIQDLCPCNMLEKLKGVRFERYGLVLFGSFA